MSEVKRGGQMQPNSDESYHVTLWRSGEGKGERLSWEQHPDGSVKGVHHTDQTTRTHSSDSRTWRKE